MSDDRAARIDKLCDEYEAKLRQNKDSPPSPAGYLDRIEEEAKRELLTELLQMEQELLAQEVWRERLSNLEDELPNFREVLAEFRNDEENSQGTTNRKSAEPLRVVGPFTIGKVLGEGGMGSVYLAQQEEPVKRQVAVKVIRAGLDSKQVIARFEAERQALALMDHPSIARIIDAGTTDTGQPYFAMELVDGVPFNQYCDQNRLSIPQRLEIFCDVCDAIQHAHQKGIIHRDLKPSNILVTEVDGKPIAKVIDFGLAKALDVEQKLTDKTMTTEFGQVLGTVKYMSPEQAGLESLDVDTRSDIYSLGVILYELLTGTTPLDDDSMRGHAILKVLELVREQDSPRPSSRISNDTERMSTIGSHRQIDLRRLNSILSGELDWVVMKSLEKDRDRRYSSANEFADDVKRYLNHEPILARPPSRAYRVRKFVRKNKGLVASLATITTLLVAGIFGTTWFAMAEQDARKLAESNEKLANDNAEQSEKDKAKAEKSAKRAQDSLKIFTDSFLSVDPSAGSNAGMLAKDVLNNAYESLKTSDLDDEGRSQLLLALSTAFLGVGEYPVAISTAQEAVEITTAKLGSDHPFTLRSLGQLTRGHLRAGQLDEAMKLGKQVLERRQRLLGADHPETVVSMDRLATIYSAAGQVEKGLELQRQAFELVQQKLGPDHPETLVSMHNMAARYGDAGQHQKVLEILQQFQERIEQKLGADHPDTLVAMSSLATAYGHAKQTEKAIELYRDVVAREKVVFGPDHPQTLVSMSSLAGIYAVAGQVEKGLEIQQQVLDLLQKKLGPSHPDTLRSMNNLAGTYWRQKKFDQSIPLFEKILELYTEKLGRGHQSTQLAVANLGANYKSANRMDEAIPLLEEAVKSGEKYPNLALFVRPLRDAYIKGKRPQKLKKLIDESMEIARNADNPENLDSVLTKGGRDLMRAEGFGEAEELYQQYYERMNARDADSWKTFNAQSLLGFALLKQNKFKEAKPLLQQGYEGLKTHSDSIPDKYREARLTAAIDRLIELAEKTENKEDLKRWKSEKESI